MFRDQYPDQHLEVRAQVSISKGEDITTQYMKSMKPTFARRPVLRSNWYFDCSCERCEDPRELGSMVSALLCTRPAPSPGKACAGPVLSSQPTRGDSHWQCHKCSYQYDSQHVLYQKTHISDYSWSKSGAGHHQQGFLRGERRPGGGPGRRPSLREGQRVGDVHQLTEFCIQVLHQFSSLLHPHHYQIIEIKEKLAQILGNFAPYSLVGMPRHLKERKRQLCQDVLDVIGRVDPGFTKTRGIMLSEMNKVNLLIAKVLLGNPLFSININLLPGRSEQVSKWHCL